MSFVSWRSVRKLPETLEQVLFYETYFEERNMDRKPLIWAEAKIITKFGQKNWLVWFWTKCTKTARKLRTSVILWNLL